MAPELPLEAVPANVDSNRCHRCWQCRCAEGQEARSHRWTELAVCTSIAPLPPERLYPVVIDTCPPTGVQ
jgi:hypothetical protein